MAKESSFDIVSELSVQEIDNALNQSRHEAATRYDLKAADCAIDFEKQELTLTLSAKDGLALKSLVDLVQTRLIRRGIDLKALRLEQEEQAAGGRMRQKGKFIQGIPMDVGKEISKYVKQTKIKVNLQIQGEQLRVTGKNRDDLQEVIRLVKEHDFGIPIQFTNYR